MKIMVFNGSPRGKQSNTHRIVVPLLEGAAQAGAQTEEIFLTECDIQNCRGCFLCWTETPGVCIIKDDMPRLLDAFLDSDYVGMATPVYGMFMTSILKKFCERLLPLNTPHFHRDKDGRFYHKGRVKSFPRQFMIANAGFPGKHNFDLFKAYMAVQNPVLEVYRNCGGILENSYEDAINRRVTEFYNALREAGKEMVINGRVSEMVIKKIHSELISDKEYMTYANQCWDREIKEGS